MTVFYTGVGNRKAPASALALCREVGRELASRGLTLRTGDAAGCDQAFRNGAYDCTDGQVQVFKAEDASSLTRDAWAYDLARVLVGPREWLTRSEKVRALFARNCMQVLGHDGREPSRFLLCWTHTSDSAAESAGGTRVAVRTAGWPNVRTDLDMIDTAIPWLNLRGLTVADALAFAHEHAGVPVLRPGDALPRRCVPPGSLVVSAGRAVWTLRLGNDMRVVNTPYGKEPNRWRGWADFPHSPSPWQDHEPGVPEDLVTLVALGLTEETATAGHLARLAEDYLSRRVAS